MRPNTGAAAVFIWLFFLPASLLPLFRGWQADFSCKNKLISRTFPTYLSTARVFGTGVSIQILLARWANGFAAGMACPVCQVQAAPQDSLRNSFPRIPFLVEGCAVDAEDYPFRPPITETLKSYQTLPKQYPIRKTKKNKDVPMNVN
jgi:hypothetical protein